MHAIRSTAASLKNEQNDSESPRASVLCGTDFSETSARATEVAAAFAQRFNEPLVLVHAVDDRSQSDLPGELKESLSLYARAQLTEERNRLRALHVGLIEAFRVGCPGKVLLAEAAECRARLIVLAAAKRPALGGLWLGGVTEGVAEAAGVPTLVIRRPEPLLRWARGGRRLRVFLAADRSAPSEAALLWVQWLRQLGPCEIVVGHLSPSFAPLSMGYFYPSLLMDDMTLEIDRQHEQQFRKYVAGSLGRSHVRLLMEKNWECSDAHLIRLAERERADLLVVGTHSRCGWRRFGHHSVSRGILHYAPMNVVCVPVSHSTPPPDPFRDQSSPNHSIL